MDEPTVGLDPVARTAVWNHVRGLREQYGTTILITSHVMEEVEALADRIGILHRGRLEKVGTAAELKAGAGPNATLDDVFALIVSGETEASDETADARRARRSAISHG
jgi:ABC-2 type transport system ATP-binding protein